MGKKSNSTCRYFILSLLFSINYFCVGQVNTSEWRSLGLTREMEADAKKKADAIGNAIEKALYEQRLKQVARQNADYTRNAAMSVGESALAATKAMSQNLNNIQAEDYMNSFVIPEDERPYIKDPINYMERYNAGSINPESLFGEGASPGVSRILANYDLETVKQELIPDLRTRLLEDFEELSKVNSGSDRAIALEKDIWLCEQDLRDFEDAVKSVDESNHLKKNMPMQVFTHEKGTLLYSKEVVEDVLDPMTEGEFLSYCQTVNSNVKKLYSGYSDYYMAESCEVIDGKFVTRIFFTNLPPASQGSIKDVKDRGVSPNLISRTDNTDYIGEIEEKIKAKKIELIRKLWTIQSYEQYQASLDRDLTSNNVYALNNMAEVVKKEVHLDLEKMIPSIVPKGVIKQMENVEEVVNQNIDGFIDSGVQSYYDDFGVQAKSYDNDKLNTVDYAIRQYNSINTSYEYAKKIVKAYGVIDNDFQKWFENSMADLDKLFGHVPSKVKGAVGKYMFFLKNRYELGSTIGLVGANISIYSMKNENQRLLKQKQEEAQSLREDIKQLEILRNRLSE